MFQKNKILKNTVVILLHLLFWTGVYFFYTYFLGYGSKNTEYVNRFSAFLIPITIATSYFMVYYLIPKYLLDKKYALFVLYSFYTIVISVYGIILSTLYGLFYLSSKGFQEAAPLTKTLPMLILGVIFIAVFVSCINLIYHHYNSTLQSDALQRKVLETELQLKEQQLRFLKMQIHPHFLFNTLNTIYGFALKQSKDTPEVILKLSNLLDYILYQVKKPLVPLQEEIEHLEDYISLEQIRFQDTLNIQLKHSIDKSVMIPPMLLIPFVENAFKHGEVLDGTLQIEITINANFKKLTFKISNSTNNEAYGTNKKGLGLENVKKRLELLYEDMYTLDIENKNGKFEVALSINLETEKNDKV